MPVLLGIFLAWHLAGCSLPAAHSTRFFVFGTLVEVHLPMVEEATASEIFGRLQADFQRMHGEWHAWEPGELVRLNAALQAGESVTTTPDILELIRRSQSLEELSGGRFNPAIGKLIALWGFHTSDYPIQGPPPSSADIALLVDKSPTALAIETAGKHLRTANPAVQLDFGGIAKGYATDLAIGIIRSYGLTSAIVNAGGDMRLIGDNSGRPWRVGVEDPAGGVAGGIEISGDAAVFTSGNYARFREDNQERYPHILDPRTGWPVATVASATVIGHDGATADAAATAIMVAGAEDWPAVATTMGIEAAMVIDESGVIHATKGMMKYFTPEKDREVRIVGAD